MALGRLGLNDAVVTADAIRDHSGRVVDLRFTFATDAAAAVLGLPANDLVGRSWLRTWPRPFAARIVELCGGVVDSRQALLLDSVTLGPQLVDIRAYQYGDDDGLVMWRDATTPARERRALAEMDDRWRRLMLSTQEGITVTDAAGVIIEMNEAAARNFGCPAEELIGRRPHELFRDLLDEDGWRFVKERLTARTPSTDRFELRAKRFDGTDAVVLISPTPVFTAEGRYDGTLALGTDITELVLARDALAASERRYRVLAENSTDVIVVTDPDGTINYISPSSLAVLGYPPEEMLGRRVHDFLDPDDASAEQVLSGRLPELPESFTRLERFRRKDGVYIWIESIIRQVVDPQTGDCVELQGAARDVTARVRALHALEASEERYRDRAVHDQLTGLPNRNLLFDRLEHALRRAERTGRYIGVLFIDVDSFKYVNDSLGHDLGDRLLTEVGRQIVSAARSDDTVARFGGDEFVVVTENIRDYAEAAAVAERVLERIRPPFDIAGTRIRATVSIGVALGRAGVETPRDLLRNADLAMYRAKQLGRDRFEVFDEAFRALAVHRLRIETELRDAVESDELLALYQAIASSETGLITGAEALLRWNHPTRGLIEPADFLDVAEDTGLITPIGAHVLQAACQQGADWLRQHPGQRITVAVNVSLRQLAWGRFLGVVEDALDATGFDATLLHLELTETVLAEASRSAQADIEALDRMGVVIGIDDFGTAYSSLSYLKRFPVRFLKVDKSFIDGLGINAADTAIVDAVVRLGHSLGLTTIAEGVETATQFSRVRDLGFTAVQGYYLARPVPFDDFADAVAAGRSLVSVDN